MMVVPQSIAYATGIALLPAQYGLYSSFIGIWVYTLLGTSKDISVGPVAIISLVVASNAGVDPVTHLTSIPDAIFLAFFAGIIQLGLGLLHLGLASRAATAPLTRAAGVIVDFISETVISAFITGAAMTIFAGQIKVGCCDHGARRSYPCRASWR